MAYIGTNLVGTGCTCDLGHDDACRKYRVVSIQSPMLRCMCVCAQHHFLSDAVPMQPAHHILLWASYLVGCCLCRTIRDMGGTCSFIRSALYGVLHCWAINRARCWVQILSKLNIDFKTFQILNTSSHTCLESRNLERIREKHSWWIKTPIEHWLPFISTYRRIGTSTDNIKCVRRWYEHVVGTHMHAVSS